MPGIYRQLYYFSLISGLVGFAIGALVARTPNPYILKVTIVEIALALLVCFALIGGKK